jgi:hypothetical protein
MALCAYGDVNRGERIGATAGRLVDYVYEALLENGIKCERRTYRASERMVAVAMIAQYEHDEKACGEPVACVLNPLKELPPPEELPAFSR